jgi:gliding motility-associated-like protein
MKMMIRIALLGFAALLAGKVMGNTASFSPESTCLGAESVFSSTSLASGGETIVAWDWDLDADGQFDDASGSVVTFQFLAAGTYQVGLRITTDLGNTDEQYEFITIYPVPLASFSAPDVCEGQNTVVTSTSTISSGSIQSWGWDLDNDGNYDDASGEVVSNDFGNDGAYAIGLIVTSDLGCQSTTSGNIVVDPVPTVNFSTSNVCLGDQTVLTAITSVNSGQVVAFAWELNGNGLYDDASGAQIQQQFISDGNYQVGLRVTTDQGCAADTSILVTIAPYPYINFNFSAACEDELVQFNNFTGNVVGTIGYTWTFGSFGTSNLTAPTFLFEENGTFQVTLTGVTSFGCSASLTQAITVRSAPVADFTFTEVCHGSQTSFINTTNANGGTIQSFLWDFDDFNVSGAVSPFHSYIAPGSYNVSLVAYTTDGCRDTVVRSVNVWSLPEPTIAANGPTEFCDGGEVELVAGPDAVTTFWSSGQSGKVITVTASGVYTVVIIDANGCRGENNITITVWPLPVLVASNDTTVSLGEDVPLWVSGASTYSWSAETFLDFPLSNSPTSSPKEDITYTVTGVDGNGCIDTEEVKITVLKDYNLKPVNLFTPNGDGKNERFYVGNIEDYPDCDVAVFNRYGNQMFQAKPYGNDWNGIFNDSPVPDGTYYYIIKCDGRPERFDGPVTVLRGK